MLNYGDEDDKTTAAEITADIEGLVGTVQW